MDQNGSQDSPFDTPVGEDLQEKCQTPEDFQFFMSAIYVSSRGEEGFDVSEFLVYVNHLYPALAQEKGWGLVKLLNEDDLLRVARENNWVVEG